MSQIIQQEKSTEVESPISSESSSRGRYDDEEPKMEQKSDFNSGPYADKQAEKIKYSCCNRCLGNSSEGHGDCACIIPSIKRHAKIGHDGCRLCGCHGCHPADKYSRHRSSSYHRHHHHGHSRHSRSSSRSYSRSRSRSSRSHSRPHVRDSELHNGCCKKCMKAFSGHACACQVPAQYRKTDLTAGCYNCGCKGCAPLDRLQN